MKGKYEAIAVSALRSKFKGDYTREALLEQIYNNYKVVDKVDFKGQIYFIVEK